MYHFLSLMAVKIFFNGCFRRRIHVLLQNKSYYSARFAYRCPGQKLYFASGFYNCQGQWYVPKIIFCFYPGQKLYLSSGFYILSRIIYSDWNKFISIHINMNSLTKITARCYPPRIAWQKIINQWKIKWKIW